MKEMPPHIARYFDDKLKPLHPPDVSFAEMKSLSTLSEEIKEHEQYGTMIVMDEKMKLDLKDKSDEELLCIADMLSRSIQKTQFKITYDNLVKEREKLQAAEDEGGKNETGRERGLEANRVC